MSKHQNSKRQASQPVATSPSKRIECVTVREIRKNFKMVVTAGVPVLVGHGWQLRALVIPIYTADRHSVGALSKAAQRIREAADRAAAQLSE
jgi:hypothetical protein